MAQFLLKPSPFTFFSASIVWTVLEYVRYQSRANDRFQGAIVASAAVLGLLPSIGSAVDFLGALFCVMPWAVHTALVVSDVLHHKAGLWICAGC